MTKNPPTKAAPVAAAVAAAIAGTVETRMLSPDLIVPSPTNPRKTFPQQSLEELAGTLKADGQIQAVTVRPLPAGRLADTFASRGEGKPLPTHELVVGERRWRAAQLAGIDLRCEVRDLTDLQVVRIQIIENLHREEVHALEEAEGYEYLVHHSAEKISVEQVAAEVGKSTAYVYQRMKLCELCPDARQAFYAGAFDASTALLIARLPTPSLQLKAIADIKDLSVDEDRAPSFRQIRAMLRQRFHLQLASAPFDITDGTLVAGCGNCVACPKRTGNQPLLFEDVGNADVCTDPDCFAGKRQASIDRTIAKFRDDGLEVIEGDRAREVLRHPAWGTRFLEDYTDINNEAFKKENGHVVTYADLVKLAGKKAPKLSLLVHPDAKDSLPYQLISDDAAEKLLAKFGPKKSGGPEPSRRQPQENEQERAERQERQRLEDTRRRYRQLLAEVVRGHVDGPRTHEDMVLVAMALAGDEISDALLEAVGAEVPQDDAARDFDYEGALRDRLVKMSPLQLASIVMRLALYESALTDYYHGEHSAETLELAAESHGVDTAALYRAAKRQVEEEQS